MKIVKPVLVDLMIASAIRSLKVVIIVTQIVAMGSITRWNTGHSGPFLSVQGSDDLSSVTCDHQWTCFTRDIFTPKLLSALFPCKRCNLPSSSSGCRSGAIHSRASLFLSAISHVFVSVIFNADSLIKINQLEDGRGENSKG